MNQPDHHEMDEASADKYTHDVMKTLLLAYETIIYALRPSIKAVGLTEPQWRVLHELKIKSPMIASELAANTFVRASSLSRILRDLEGRDLVTRSQQFEDLRKTLVSITEYGHREIADIEAQYVDVLGRLEASVGRRAINDCMNKCLLMAEQFEQKRDTAEA